MKFITGLQHTTANEVAIGGKAGNLLRLREMGLTIPKWVVIPAGELSGLIEKNVQHNDPKNSITFINNFDIPASFINEISDHFTGTKFFAVRSSAVEEDGNDFSFAGQFESYLFVTKETLAENIKKVWRSAFSERVIQYKKNNNLATKNDIAIIIQEMIDADAAGVAFSINTVNGDRTEKLISSVFGVGEGLVSGQLNADNFIVKDNKINAMPTDKAEQFVLNNETTGGIKKIPVEESKRKTASLTDVHVYKIARILDICTNEFGKPQDIEFAVSNNKVYLLQSRPITNLKKITGNEGEYILWDNSNIIESYPGVTTPLTFSFISRSYKEAYKLFSGFMGVSPKVIKQNERVFANTLGLINGRVYYNLRTWYHMLAMLPGYSINAGFMEKMMGVKERFDLPETYRLSKTVASWRIVKMVVQMYRRFLSLDKKRKEFMQLVDDTIFQYKKINYPQKDAHELMQLYLEFEKKLLNEWKAPLLNDFFAMIWFGLLQKRCEKYAISNNPNIHNDLLCGSSDIISTQPMHRSIAIATSIAADNELKELFFLNDGNLVWKRLSASKEKKYIKLKKDIDTYIADFGERCVGELKLETISFTQNPAAFIKLLASYVATGITAEKVSGKIEEAIRSKAEMELNNSLKNKFFKRWKLKRTLRHARRLVSARENLRYQRTRAFGIVREIFSHLGKKFYAEGIIEDARDIFYLTKEEIFSFIEGTSVTQNLKALISLRKSEFEEYKKQPPPSERFATYGIVYHANDFFSKGKIEKIEGDLKGIGCCPGRVRGKVKVVLDPSTINSLNGDILVTLSTDPGWVTLFPGAAGIIVERGSLLSHSAIVCREMGKPCIVSVTGLLKTLNTGDEIEMDGSTGEIKIINKAR